MPSFTGEGMRYYSPYRGAGRAKAYRRTHPAASLIVFLFLLAACEPAGPAPANIGGATGPISTNPGILAPGAVPQPRVAAMETLAQSDPYTLVGTDRDVNGLPLNPMWATQAYYDRPDPCAADRDALD